MNKRRLFALALAVCMLAAILAGCSSGNAGTGTGTATETATGTPGGTDQPKYTLKFGHDQPVEHAYHLTGLEFARLVKEKSNGQIEVEVYPNAQLGTEATMLESLALGTLDFELTATANASTYVPELGMVSVCYLFKDSDHLAKAASDTQINDFYKNVTKEKNTGFELLTLQAGGCRQLYSTTAIADLNALKDKKMRVMPSPVESQVWSALGAKPTSVSFGEVYTALQTHMVEAAENTLSSYYAAKHYEVAPYLNESFHQWSILCLWASDATMAKLPADLQDVVREAATEAAAYGFEAQLKNDAQFKEQLQAAGVTFTTVDTAAWAEKVKPIQDEVAAQYKTEDVLKRIRELA